MKKLGLIGGTGPESTVIYYKRIIEGVQAATGPDNLAPLNIESLSAFDVFKYAGQRDWDGLTEYLLAGIKNLQAAGAEVASLTANTPHVVFDRLEAASPLPLISSITSTRREIRARGVHNVVLLGTEFTMREDFLSGPLREDGLNVILPNDSEITYIQDKIASELELGIVKDDTRQGFVDIIARLVAEEGAELVILGCTELPLLLDDSTSPIPTLDTMDPHVEDLVQVVLG